MKHTSPKPPPKKKSKRTGLVYREETYVLHTSAKVFCIGENT